MNRLQLISVIIALMLLAYFRENVILILNGAISGGTSYKANADIPDILQQANPDTLKLWKIALNFLFLFFILSLTYFAIKKYFSLTDELIFIKWTFILLPFALMGLFFLSNVLSLNLLRSIALDGIWFMQTPIPFMLLFGYFYFDHSKK